jgi:hypothetical protein
VVQVDPGSVGQEHAVHLVHIGTGKCTCAFASSLPQALFGARPQQLWESLSAASTVSIYLGEYRLMETPLPAMRWISRRDAEAVADIVEYLSTPGNIGRPGPQVITEYVPFRFAPKSPTMTKKFFQEDVRQTKAIFDEMRAREPTCSAILIGSQRVNYLLEYLVADLFDCRAFHPTRRRGKIPFYLKYREQDRAVPSCIGGSANPPGCRNAAGPGTYYLNEENNWVACPWREEQEDSGVVITVRDPGDKSMELALFGFSGRATVVISKHLTEAVQGVDRFWKPTGQSKGRQVGVYVCRFTLTPQNETEMSKPPKAKQFQVIPIPEPVLEACLR